MPTEYDYDRQNEEIGEFQAANLKLLEVLLTNENYLVIMGLLKQKTITGEALCLAGDILITSLRRYC